MSTPATAQQLQGLLGDVDAIAVERILATHATEDEVREALAALDDEDSFGELSELPISPKVAEVRELIVAYVLDDRDEVEQSYANL
jgi:hypothetical protein